MPYLIRGIRSTRPVWLKMATIFLCYGTANAEIALLDIPAQMSKHSSKSVLLSLTRAGNRIVAVGERGYILISDDNGITWLQVTVPVSVALTSVFLIQLTNSA